MSLFQKRRARGGRSTGRLRPDLEGLEGRVVLSTFRVNTTLDTVAVDLKTGKDAAGHVSLRSAIMAADAQGGTNKIILPAGTFLLTLAGANEDNDATGDLDIKANVSIKGRGAGNTVIDGNNLDRVIQVLSGKVSITGVTIQHGRVTGDGGGILNSGGQVGLDAVVVANNWRSGRPGLSVAAPAATRGAAGSSTGGR